MVVATSRWRNQGNSQTPLQHHKHPAFDHPHLLANHATDSAPPRWVTSLVYLLSCQRKKMVRVHNREAPACFHASESPALRKRTFPLYPIHCRSSYESRQMQDCAGLVCAHGYGLRDLHLLPPSRSSNMKFLHLSHQADENPARYKRLRHQNNQ